MICDYVRTLAVEVQPFVIGDVSDDPTQDFLIMANEQSKKSTLVCTADKRMCAVALSGKGATFVRRVEQRPSRLDLRPQMLA